MDDTRQPLEADLSCAPRLARNPEADQSPSFVPLRLLLHPGGLCVEITKANMLVGRHSGADVRLSLPDVSRRHCRFVFADGNWRIVDLNSLNGIFINGERLDEATVFHGDRIRIGSLTFEVEMGAVERAALVIGQSDRMLPAGEDSQVSRRKAS
jgi:pSer/pThr/pTyr-binding forkhead associated (FHA) protein